MSVHGIGEICVNSELKCWSFFLNPGWESNLPNLMAHLHLDIFLEDSTTSYSIEIRLKCR